MFSQHVSHIETYYEYQSAWVTYAEMCNPKILYRPFKTAAPSRAVATILPIPIKYQKVDCCQLCADTLNCMYWNYGPGGKCKIVYGTDQISDPSGPEICPNGLDYGGFTDQSTPYDMKNYFGAGPCSGGALYMSDEHYGDWCEESDWYCDDCNYYGGDSCK